MARKEEVIRGRFLYSGHIDCWYIFRNCSVCGRELKIEMKEGAGMNKDGHYFGTIRLGIGMWGKYRWDTNPDGSIKFVRIISRWRELWYRLIDLKRRLFHQYKDVEYWECDDCYNKAGKKHDS